MPQLTDAFPVRFLPSYHKPLACSAPISVPVPCPSMCVSRGRLRAMAQRAKPELTAIGSPPMPSRARAHKVLLIPQADGALAAVVLGLGRAGADDSAAGRQPRCPTGFPRATTTWRSRLATACGAAVRLWLGVWPVSFRAISQVPVAATRRFCGCHRALGCTRSTLECGQRLWRAI